jgi:23S rRNA pseudouridine1911/1915/1917 synthase
MSKSRKPPRPEATKAPEGASGKLARSWTAKVGPGGAARADAYVAEVSGVLSRSQIKARKAVIRVNGAEAKGSRPLKEGDELEVRWTEEEPDSLGAEELPLSILFEDERVIVVDKAQGMVTHPGAGNRRGTLANALLYILQRDRAATGPAKLRSLAGQSPVRPAPARAGIVHRLDKDTSGGIVAAKDLEAQVFLAEQFKERAVRKEYLAILRGIPEPRSGRIADRLGRDRRDRKRFASVAEGGRQAITDYRVLASWAGSTYGSSRRPESYSLVSLRPRTGRTHQLRVHMSGFGTPILGDPIYGTSRLEGRFRDATLMLHAYRLRITLPGADRPAVFRAPLPARLKNVLLALAEAFGRGVPGA